MIEPVVLISNVHLKNMWGKMANVKNVVQIRFQHKTKKVVCQDQNPNVNTEWKSYLMENANYALNMK